MAQRRLTETNRLLLALVPALGPRAALGPQRALLKWAGPEPLKVERCTLEFFDATGQIVDRRQRAYGLSPGVQLDAPYSRILAEDRLTAPEAWTQRWTLNDWSVGAPAREPEDAWSNLVLTCLPLKLPSRDDKHFIVGVVNTGDEPLDIADGVQNATCWVDGIAWPSVAGRIWNGPYLLRPGHSTIRSSESTEVTVCASSGTSGRSRFRAANSSWRTQLTSRVRVPSPLRAGYTGFDSRSSECSARTNAQVFELT